MTLFPSINADGQPQHFKDNVSGFVNHVRDYTMNFFQHLSGPGVKMRDVEAELFSHMKIINESALLSVSDLKGNIIHANEKFCKISGYEKEELLHKPHSMIRHPDTHSSVFKEMWRTIGNGNVWQGEIKNLAKDGSSYWVIATVAPVLGANGKPVKYISVRYDITTQKLAEEELRETKKKVDNELMENIEYAKYIHSAFLSVNEEMGIFGDHFLLYKAQKMISGDFYKIEDDGHKLTIAIGDSTGHGVSASYISILALSLLSKTLETCYGNPAKILRTMNSDLCRITRSNKKIQLTESADMIVCFLDMEFMRLTYASAGMRAFIIRKGEIILLEKEKCTIGDCVSHNNFNIVNKCIAIEKGDNLYIFSDGLIDQLGGPQNKRIGCRKLISLVKEMHAQPMKLQKKIAEDFLSEWRGKHNEQTDDITFFGIKI